MIPTNVEIQTPFIPGPIASAAKLRLVESAGGQPNVGEALLDWFVPIVIGVITVAIGDGAEGDEANAGVAKETMREVRTSGCFLAGDGAKLDVQAGGERSWENGTLYTTPDFNVATDSKLRIVGVRYRIMKKGDWSVNGYVRYELLEDYAPAGTPAQSP